MNTALTIRWAGEPDRAAVLAFIAEMGFNLRDAVTWDALAMTAMTAWDRARLIGAIPLEPRVLQLAPGVCVPTAHETVVAVHPAFRGGGIGSRLQQAIFAAPPQGAQLISVFREDPSSPAYRWYLHNGFAPVMHVESWFCDDPAALATDDRCSVEPPEDGGLDWASMAHLWQRLVAGRPGAGGFVDRGRRPLGPWLAVHPYRHRYEFRVVSLYRGDALAAYTLLGIGTMHSQSTRVDLLEWVCEPSDARRLLGAVATHAAGGGYHPIRWPLAQADPHVALVRELGFASRWSFDMLVRPVGTPHSSLTSASAAWRYAGIDYI